MITFDSAGLFLLSLTCFCYLLTETHNTSSLDSTITESVNLTHTHKVNRLFQSFNLIELYHFLSIIYEKINKFLNNFFSIGSTLYGTKVTLSSFDQTVLGVKSSKAD